MKRNWSLLELVMQEEKKKKATARGKFSKGCFYYSKVFLLSSQSHCSGNTENIARTW